MNDETFHLEFNFLLIEKFLRQEKKMLKDFITDSS